MVLLPLLVIGFIVLLVGTGRNRTAPQPELRAVRRLPTVPETTGESRREWRVALALARPEAWRLVKHPAVLVGAALSVWGSETTIFSEGYPHVLPAGVTQAVLASFPLAGMTLIAVNLATLRSRREGTDEVVGPAAASVRARTLGHLLSLVGPMALWTLLLAMWLVRMLRGHERVAAALGGDVLVELAWGPVLVGCAGACGVLLARLIPSPAVAPLALLLLAWVQGVAATGPRPETNRLVWLGWWVDDPLPAEVWPREYGWHLLYLAALGLVVASAASLVSGRTGGGWAALAVALAVAGGAAVVQVQPLSEDEIARVAGWVGDPAAHQDCESEGLITTCAYPAYDFSDEWRRVAEGVVAALPEAARPRRIVVAQRAHPYDLRNAPPRLRDALPEEQAPLPPHDIGAMVELRWGGDGDSELILGLELATAAVGLPDRPGGGARSGGGCYLGGQARGVVALWIAGRSTEGAGAELSGGGGGELSVEQLGEPLEPGLQRQPDEVAGAFYSTPELAGWVMTGGSAFTWAVTDHAYAADLLRRPAAQVAAAIERSWSELVAPTTSTDRLAELLSVPKQASVEDLARNSGVDPSAVTAPAPPCR